MRKRTMPLLLAAGLVLTACPKKHPVTHPTAGLTELAEAAVPAEVGSRERMQEWLTPQAGSPQLGGGFRFESAIAAVKGTSLAASRPVCEHGHAEDGSARPPGAAGRCTYRGAEGVVLKTDLGAGRITFLDRNRSFQAKRRANNEVSVEAAMKTAFESLVGLGVPRNEIDALSLRPRELMVTGAPVDGGKPVVLRAEVHALFARQISGTPVFNSEGHVAIDANGDPARLHVRWRDFCLTPGLSPAQTLSRQTVVETVARRVGVDTERAAISRLDAYVAYVSARDLEAPGSVSSAEEEDDEAPAGGDCYVPALVVTVHPREAAEDSGEISEAGQLVTIPLLAATAGDGGRSSY